MLNSCFSFSNWIFGRDSSLKLEAVDADKNTAGDADKIQNLPFARPVAESLRSASTLSSSERFFSGIPVSDGAASAVPEVISSPFLVFFEEFPFVLGLPPI